MARIARVVIPGLPHHVVQRGVRSIPLFHSDDDRRGYLDLLKGTALDYGLRFWAWALMDNHVHFLVVPEGERSLQLGIGRAHWNYTRAINFREGVRGHLFQERFHSYPVQRDEHACAVGRYIEMNPVKARIVRKAQRYPWSSAAYNAGARESDPLVDARELAGIVGNWGELLQIREAELERERVERHVGTGRPFGDETWVASLEKQTGRKLAASPVGWPKGKPRRKGKRKGEGDE